MGVMSAISSYLKNPAPARVDPYAQDSYAHLRDEQNAVFTIKQSLLAQARASAGNERPSLEDYRRACEAFAETEQGQQMVADGRWNPRAYANLDGQDVSGFMISEPKKRATENLIERATENLMNQDGDRTINDFYTNISFYDANLKNAYVDPATSFNEEVAKAKNLEGLTFNGMVADDTFTFAVGNYKNIKMTNIKGGEIVFASGKVDGLDIEGTEAKIALGADAVVEHMHVSKNFRIITLDMAPGAMLANSNLEQVTVSMTSRTAGATFQNVNITGNLDGLDLSGARLNNFSINGQPITDSNQLKEFGVGFDATTRTSTSPEFLRQHQLAQIRGTMQQAVASIGSASTPAAAPEAALAAAPAPSAASSVANDNPFAAFASLIRGGDSVGLNDVALTAAVASLERTVPLNEQASGANMSRSATA